MPIYGLYCSKRSALQAMQAPGQCTTKLTLTCSSLSCHCVHITGVLAICDFCQNVCHPDTCLQGVFSADAPVFACDACTAEAVQLALHKAACSENSALLDSGRMPQFARLLQQWSAGYVITHQRVYEPFLVSECMSVAHT